MKQDYLNKLEYNKILEMLANFCHTYLAKELANNLKPSFNKENVTLLLNETKESLNILERKGSIPIFDINDISIWIKKLESNINLSSKALIDIAKILQLSRELKEYFFKDKNFPISNYQILEACFSSLYSNISIEQDIYNKIIDENNIADNASAKLSSLRKNKRKIEIDIKESLNKFIHSPTYSKYIMESIITIRNDRYVIPVKEEYRSFIKGFIHDISSSGSTVFIEPLQIFELNNKINSLKIEEDIEIEHILEDLSNEIKPYIKELKNNLYLIGKIDFIFAKAYLAKEMNASCVNICDSKKISLIKARHPLIDVNKVISIDILIGENYTSLIITGPNTGGKTVTLKTTGLLLLMCYSGLFIPADETSSIYVFDNIFTDIGDEQSIQESLSTFSAHMTNIINIIKEATSNSIILLDELGSGTDPIEGSALAISILEYFHKIGALTLATTHYQEIKNYALITEGFENASSEFDIEKLKPTYKLLIGIPGKSNAFAISEKLGLPNNILDNAKSILKEDEISIEELLKNIYDDKINIENQKDEISKNLTQIESLRKSLEKDTKIKTIKENQIIEKAKLEAKNIILSAKDDVNSTIKETEEILNNWKILNELDFQNLSDSEIANIVKEIKKYSIKNANEQRNKLNASLNSIYKDKGKSSNSNISINQLKTGMNVKLNNLNDIATIISIPNKGKQIQVQIGNIKMNANINDIISIENSQNKNKEQKINNNKTSSLKAKIVNPEINVIGKNVDEACFIIDKYLDDCYLAKIQNARIVHGKGTGKLREGIHVFLRKHPHVKSFRIGSFGEGEMGVTIIELK